MTSTLTDHLADLAVTLNDLRQRFRQAARDEVARAVGDALRQVALRLIGSSPRPLPRRSPYSEWDDPWQDTTDDPWETGTSLREDNTVRERSVGETTALHPAVLAGLWAARWGFVRTRQPLPAVALGLAIGLIALVGGPTIEALLAVWLETNSLLYSADAARWH